MAREVQDFLQADSRFRRRFAGLSDCSVAQTMRSSRRADRRTTRPDDPINAGVGEAAIALARPVKVQKQRTGLRATRRQPGERRLDRRIGQGDKGLLMAPFALNEKGVSGNIEIGKIERLFDMEIEADDFTTIAGLVINESGKVPQPGEQLTFRGLELEVLEADERRIGRLRVRRAAVRKSNGMSNIT